MSTIIDDTEPRDDVEAAQTEVPERPGETAPDDETTEAGQDDTADHGDRDDDEDDNRRGSGNPSREAANYRRRLREAEAERDAVAGRLDTLQRAEVERIAANTLAVPAGLWASGVALADMLDDNGNIDPGCVAAAIDIATRELGLAPRPLGNVAPLEGHPSRIHHSSTDQMLRTIMGGNDV